MEEPSQGSLVQYGPLGCSLSQLLVILVPLKAFRLQAAQWKRLVRLIVCAIKYHLLWYTFVCNADHHSLPLPCSCIPTSSSHELVAFLLSSTSYCLSPSSSFYFWAENVNQPEKMQWFIYVGGFENSILCRSLFHHNNKIVLSQSKGLAHEVSLKVNKK